MADKRIVPEPLIYERQGDSTVLRPQAAPLDNFVRTAEPVKSPLHEVASALAIVNPKLHAWLDRKTDEMNFDDARKAHADATSSTAKSWQEAIDKGIVSPGQSPLYQRVYEETLGKNGAISEAGPTLTQKWNDPANPIRNSQDPAAINKWLQENTVEMLKGKSQDYVNGFNPQLTAVKQQLVQQWTAENVKNLEEDNRNAFGVLQRNRILSLAKSGASADTIAEALANDTIPQQFAGMARKDINKLQAQAIIDAAVSTGNTNLLKVGYADRPDVKSPGRMIPGVFNIPGFSQHAQAAETSILSKAHVAESRGLMAQQRADSATLNQLVGQEAIKARNDPNYKTDDATFARIAMLPHGATMLQANVQAAGKQGRAFDPVFAAPAIERLVNVTSPNSGASLEEKTKAVSEVLPYMSTAQQVAGLYQMIQKGDGKDAPLLHSEVYKDGVRGLEKLQDGLVTRLDPMIVGLAAREARSRLTMFTLKYDADHQGGVDQQKFQQDFEAEASKIIKEMKDRVEGSLNLGTTSTTTKPAPGARPGTTSAPQAPTPAAPAPAAPAPAAAAPAAPQQGATPAAPAAPTSLSNMIPTDRLVDPVSSAKLDPMLAHKVPDWVPKTVEGLDYQTINLLRSDPNRDVNGKPLWQHFEDRYGVGSANFLLTANSGEINYLLKKAGFHNTPSKPFTTNVDELAKGAADFMAFPPSNNPKRSP